MIEALELFFDKGFDAFSTCESVLQLLEAAGIVSLQFQVAESKKVPAGKLVAHLRKRKDASFWADSERVFLKTTPYSGGGVSMDVEFRDGSAPALNVLDQWMPSVLGSGHGRYARLFDSEWEQWQNEKQINKFELVGRPTTGLKRTWDPVFDREIIDTSANPGRIALRRGYLEALGHEMWLTTAFWPLTGCKPAAVKQTLRTRLLPGEILGVKLSERPFGDDNVIPESVRALLFPAS